MQIIKFLSALTLFGSIAWFIATPSYEPAITSVTSLSAFLTSLFVKKRTKQPATQSQSIAKNATGIQAGGNVKIINIQANESTVFQTKPIERISNLSYSEIEKAINEAPPLQRSSVAKAYEGIRISWIVYLINGRFTDDRKKIFLSFACNKNLPFFYVQCEVPADEYPELNILHNFTPICISGKITSVKHTQVELIDVHIEILRDINNAIPA